MAAWAPLPRRPLVTRLRTTVMSYVAINEKKKKSTSRTRQYLMLLCSECALFLCFCNLVIEQKNKPLRDQCSFSLEHGKTLHQKVRSMARIGLVF